MAAVNRNVRKRDSSPRPAFTLIEIVLVLALMVMMAAISWPLVRGPLAAQRLRSAAEQVQAAWAGARTEAMTSGLIQMFRYQPQSGTYQVQAWGGFDAAVEGKSAGDFQQSESFEPVAEVGGERLPETIVFVGAIGQTDTRAVGTAGLAAASSPGGSSSAAPSVLFYPDGTTSTVELQLANDQAQRVAISLRGLTGIVTVSKIFSGEELRR